MGGENGGAGGRNILLHFARSCIDRNLQRLIMVLSEDNTRVEEPAEALAKRGGKRAEWHSSSRMLFLDALLGMNGSGGCERKRMVN